jgi:hypothetical protein
VNLDPHGSRAGGIALLASLLRTPGTPRFFPLLRA